MKQRYTYILFFVLFVLSGCLDDSTNLNYKEVILPDSVKVIDHTNNREILVQSEGSFQGSLSTIAGQEMFLDVECIYKGNETLTYEWLWEGESIGTEKELHYKFTEEGRLTLLICRDGSREKATDYPLRINVTPPFGNGVYVLAKNGDETVLDFMRYYTITKVEDFLGQSVEVSVPVFEEESNVYSLYNDGEKLSGTQPVGLVWGQGNDPSRTKVLQLLDKDWRSSVSVYLEDLKKVIDMKHEFIENPDGLVVKGMQNIGYTTLLYGEDGKVYSRVNYDKGVPNTGSFSSVPLRFDDPNDVPDKGWMEVSASSIMVDKQTSNTWGLIHEKEKGRFLLLITENIFLGTGEQSTVMPFPQIAFDPGKNEVGLDDFKKEVIGTYPPSSGWQKPTYILYKDETGYYLQSVVIEGDNWSWPPVLDYSIQGVTKVPDDVTVLLDKEGAFVLKLEINRTDMFFVMSDNTIWETDANFSNKKKVYTFDTESRITHFFKLMPWTSDTSSEQLQYFSGRVLAVGFANGDFKLVKLYKDPNKPGETQMEVLLEKHYDGGIADIKYIYSNVIM